MIIKLHVQKTTWSKSGKEKTRFLDTWEPKYSIKDIASVIHHASASQQQQILMGTRKIIGRLDHVSLPRRIDAFSMYAAIETRHYQISIKPQAITNQYEVINFEHQFTTNHLLFKWVP